MDTMPFNSWQLKKIHKEQNYHKRRLSPTEKSDIYGFMSMSLWKPERTKRAKINCDIDKDTNNDKVEEKVLSFKMTWKNCDCYYQWDEPTDWNQPRTGNFVVLVAVADQICDWLLKKNLRRQNSRRLELWNQLWRIRLFFKTHGFCPNSSLTETSP